MDYGIQNEINQMPCHEITYGEGGIALDAMNGSNWRCIDGRYETEGKLAFPGASLGFLMVAISTFYRLGFMDNAVQDKLISILKKEMGVLSYHSDNHKHDSDFLCAGCGHVMLAHNNPDKYDMPKDWLERINGQLSYKDGEILYGKHEEQCVVFFENTKETPLPSGKLINGSVFVLHLGVATEVLKYLSGIFVREFHIDDPELMQRALLESMKTHITATANVLAKDLPKYSF